MSSDFDIYLIKRTKIINYDEVIKVKSVPVVRQLSNFFKYESDAIEHITYDRRNFYAWEKLQEMLKVEKQDYGWIEVTIKELKELKSVLQDDLQSSKLTEKEKYNYATGISHIDWILPRYKRYHVIVASYT